MGKELLPEMLIATAYTAIAISIIVYLYFKHKRLFSAHKYQLVLLALLLMSGAVSYYERVAHMSSRMLNYTDWVYVTFVYLYLAYLTGFYLDQWNKPTRREYLNYGKAVRDKMEDLGKKL